MRLFSILSTLLFACAQSEEALSQITIGRNESIVIVGGGPAGIHYASLLAKKGFTNITLLEASAAFGGKSISYMDPLGYHHELGTCYAHGLYTPVFDLIKEYDPTNVKIPFVPTVKGHTRIHQDNVDEVFDYNTFIAKLAQERSGATTQAATTSAINDGFRKYIALHRSIFGAFDYGLPPKPKNWSLVNMPAYDFLQKNNLMVLEAFFRYVFEQQGYGSLDNTPAFYMLWWIHPDVILKRLQLATPDSPWVFMLSKGYQSLWKSMVSKFESKVNFQLNTRVTDITRGRKGATIKVRRSSGEDTITCDHLVMAIDLSLNAPLPNNLTPTESSLLEDQYIASTFVVSLVQSDALPNETVSEWWPYRGADNSQGRLQLTRNTRLALFNPLPAHGSPLDPIPTDWGVNATGRQTRIMYQYHNRKAQPNDSELNKQQLLSDMAEANFTNPEFVTQIVFNYSPRFRSLEKGSLWDIWSQQGAMDTTWIGSSVSFESVLDVVTYNNRLIQRVQFKDEIVQI